MTPASLHRIAFGGEDDPQFVTVGSWFVIAAPLPLALGIALDTYVAADRAVQSPATAVALAAVAIVALLGHGTPTRFGAGPLRTDSQSSGAIRPPACLAIRGFSAVMPEVRPNICGFPSDDAR
jgi:hypothetical protein